MARPLRVEFAGAWYHVYNEAPRNFVIASDDIQKQYFVDLIADATRMFSLETHAWCLLENEYHLLVKTKQANLGRAMRHIGGVYTQFMNREYDHEGALFKGRYRAILIEPNEYSAPVSRYIHQRPVETQLVKCPEDYHWSSAKHYLNDTNNSDANEWLTTRTVLDSVARRAGQPLASHSQSQDLYRDYLNAEPEPELTKFYKAKRKKSVLASSDYLNTIGGDRPQRYEARPNESAAANTSADLDKILQAVADAFDVDRDSLDQSGRKGSPNIPRLAGLYIARNRAGRSYQEIAGQFSITNTASVGGLVSQAAKSVKADPELEAAVEALCKKLEL